MPNRRAREDDIGGDLMHIVRRKMGIRDTIPLLASQMAEVRPGPTEPAMITTVAVLLGRAEFTIIEEAAVLLGRTAEWDGAFGDWGTMAQVTGDLVRTTTVTPARLGLVATDLADHTDTVLALRTDLHVEAQVGAVSVSEAEHHTDLDRFGVGDPCTGAPDSTVIRDFHAVDHLGPAGTFTVETVVADISDGDTTGIHDTHITVGPRATTRIGLAEGTRKVEVPPMVNTITLIVMAKSRSRMATTVTRVPLGKRRLNTLTAMADATIPEAPAAFLIAMATTALAVRLDTVAHLGSADRDQALSRLRSRMKMIRRLLTRRQLTRRLPTRRGLIPIRLTRSQRKRNQPTKKLRQRRSRMTTKIPLRQTTRR